MALVNQAERVEETLKRLVKKITAEVKASSLNFEEIISYANTDGTYGIQVENNGGAFSENMADIVAKDKYAILISKKEHQGCYDWAAKTYICDASSVTFKI